MAGVRSAQSVSNSRTATAAVGNSQAGRGGRARCGWRFRPGRRPGPPWPGCVRSASRPGTKRAVPGPGRAGSARWPRNARGSNVTAGEPPSSGATSFQVWPGPARDRADHDLRQVAVAAQPAPDDRGVTPPALGQGPLRVRHVRPVRLGVPQQDQPPRRVACHGCPEVPAGRAGSRSRWPASRSGRPDRPVASTDVLMMPRSGLLSDLRDSTTVARTRRVSPGRTGYGQRSSSRPRCPRLDSADR